MAKGRITIGRNALDQPNVANTKKGQKRFQQEEEYNPQRINAELDYIHERINQVVVEDPPLEDLVPGTANLTQVTIRVNELTEILRRAGLLRV